MEKGLNLEHLAKILSYLPKPDRVEVYVSDPPMPPTQKFQEDFPGLKFSGVIIYESPDHTFRGHVHTVSGMTNEGIVKLLRSERGDRILPFGTHFKYAEWNSDESKVTLDKDKLAIAYPDGQEPEFVTRMRAEVSGLELRTTQTFAQTERFYRDDVC